MVVKRLDALGDRMKAYERQETELRFMPNTWLYVRIDGRSFSKFTKGLARPYDARLSQLMVDTLKYLVGQTNATIGYAQSDEMSLLIYNGYETNTAIFDGKKQKMCSIIAGLASGYFNKYLAQVIPEKEDYCPIFDCRVFAVPNAVEAMNAIYWRELDCIKNSITASAHEYFSHKELHKKNSSVMKDMLLKQKDIRWDDYPNFFKYGTYVKRVKYQKETEDGPVLRTRIDIIDERVGNSEMTPVDRIQFVTDKYYGESKASLAEE